MPDNKPKSFAKRFDRVLFLCGFIVFVGGLAGTQYLGMTHPPIVGPAVAAAPYSIKTFHNIVAVSQVERTFYDIWQFASFTLIGVSILMGFVRDTSKSPPRP